MACLCGFCVGVGLSVAGVVFVSRGYGVVQREILAAVNELEPGQVLLVGGGFPGGRRAARRLASEGVISVRLMLVDSRWCLVAERPSGGR